MTGRQTDRHTDIQKDADTDVGTIQPDRDGPTDGSTKTDSQAETDNDRQGQAATDRNGPADTARWVEPQTANQPPGYKVRDGDMRDGHCMQRGVSCGHRIQR